MNFGVAFLLACVASLVASVAACGPKRPVSPDLTTSQAAEMISHAPEFNRYAHLQAVETTAREGDSLADCCYYGYFMFRYLSAPSDATPIKAQAQFRYYDGVWHLFNFTYGCPGSGCQTVWVQTPPLKGKTPY